jgi:putative sterol carrier protein
MKTTRDDLVIRAMALAHMVNQYTEYCVFVNYSGHVQSMEIRISQSKQLYSLTVLETEFYTAYKQHSGPDAEIQAKIDVLSKILHEKLVPFDDLEYTESIVKKYTF